MLKQILCCSLLIAQICAEEFPWSPFQGDVYDFDMNMGFSHQTLNQESIDLPVEPLPENLPVDYAPVSQAPMFPVIVFSLHKNQKKASNFTAAEDAGIAQYVQAHPGTQNWEMCLKWLTEQGIIAPGARTSKQLCRRYNRYLKQRPGSAAVSGRNYAPRFTEAEDEALLQIVREHPDLSWEERAKLFAEKGVSVPNVQRTPDQLSRRYFQTLKRRPEFAEVNHSSLSPEVTAEEN